MNETRDAYQKMLDEIEAEFSSEYKRLLEEVDAENKPTQPSNAQERKTKRRQET